MFSAIQTEYIQTLIETMNERGYKYYVARTNTDTNSTVQLEIVFSKQPINANSMYSYTVVDGVRYSVDSRAYSTSQGNHARVTVANYSGNYTFNQYEFCYTNAVYGKSVTAVQPDIRQLGGVNNVYSQTGFYVLVGILLVAVVFRFFSRRV